MSPAPKTAGFFMSKAKEQHHVVGTSKVDSVRVLEKAYGLRVLNTDPELLSKSKEPSSKNPLMQASWKAHQIVLGYSVAENEILTVHTADTVYKHNGVDTFHKPGNENGKLGYGESLPDDPDVHEQYILEAIGMYGQAFVAVWENAMVDHAVNKWNRAVLLDVQVEFPKMIEPEYIRENYNPRFNTRIPLAEAAIERGLQFTVSNHGRGERHPISGGLALQLLVDRVLKPDWHTQMLTKSPAREYKDPWNNRRGIVEVDFARRVRRS